VVLWSTVATGFKLGLAHFSITQLLFLGTSFSWLIFAGATLLRWHWHIEPQDRLLAIGLGLINPCLYYFVLFGAYDRLPAHIAQPLNYTWAITLALLAVPMLKQSLTRKTLLGIGVSYVGVIVLVNLSSNNRETPLDAFGIFLALASTLIWAFYWLLNARSRSHPTNLMFWSFSAALPVLGFLAWHEGGLPTIDGNALIYGAWVGCVEMGVTFLLWQTALRMTSSVARVSQLIFVSPFLSLIFIHQFLEEQINPLTILALLLIVAGLVLTNRGKTPSS
jgi:drug/metabolite transporter (DMT)-like permease